MWQMISQSWTGSFKLKIPVYWWPKSQFPLGVGQPHCRDNLRAQMLVTFVMLMTEKMGAYGI